jgi:hypothetical protein
MQAECSQGADCWQRQPGRRGAHTTVCTPHHPHHPVFKHCVTHRQRVEVAEGSCRSRRMWCWRARGWSHSWTTLQSVARQAPASCCQQTPQPTRRRSQDMHMQRQCGASLAMHVKHLTPYKRCCMQGSTGQRCGAAGDEPPGQGGVGGR